MEYFGYIGKKSTFKKSKKKIIPFEQFSYGKYLLEKSIFVSIPIDTIRVFLYFEPNGESFFMNTNSEISESELSFIPSLAGTVLDGYYLVSSIPSYDEESIFYPFDIVQFKGRDVTKNEYKSRFEMLLYTIDIINTVPGTLTISTNFDETVITETNTFLLFIPLNSTYTPGKVNKRVHINIIQNPYISLNVKSFRGNRWKVNFEGKSIPETLLPQNENSIEIPVVFTKDIKDNDIILFKINTNKNGRINHNKPLLPVEKIDSHINDYTDITNMLAFIQTV